MLFVRAVWNENGKEMEGTIPDAWVNVAEKTLRWPKTRAKYCFDNHVAPKEDWETFPLLKVKITSESFHECEDYDQTSHAELCEEDEDEEDLTCLRRLLRRMIKKSGKEWASTDQIVVHPGLRAVTGQLVVQPGLQAVTGQLVVHPGLRAVTGQLVVHPGLQAVTGQLVVQPGLRAVTGQLVVHPGLRAVTGQLVAHPGLWTGQLVVHPGLRAVTGQLVVHPGLQAVTGQLVVQPGLRAVTGQLVAHPGLWTGQLVFWVPQIRPGPGLWAGTVQLVVHPGLWAGTIQAVVYTGPRLWKVFHMKCPVIIGMCQPHSPCQKRRAHFY
ncbi:uncharacterized protein LOC120548673 isoform X12 [Perca fluviatilis]|uniref:uncharacterized protein LOC120548673 isoform X12 n=1 Tax=Perca fluviatilis TaxID=8168 RepID=UPI0019654CCB|nr:uncharacterized protein LOC120548673 isoform X12 [Perca fluviatilis]